MKGRTCFLIAYRFSTVIYTDRILVIDDGRVAVRGKHDELMDSCDVYRRLYETQLLGTNQYCRRCDAVCSIYRIVVLKQEVCYKNCEIKSIQPAVF